MHVLYNIYVLYIFSLLHFVETLIQFGHYPNAQYTAVSGPEIFLTAVGPFTMFMGIRSGFIALPIFAPNLVPFRITTLAIGQSGHLNGLMGDLLSRLKESSKLRVGHSRNKTMYSTVRILPIFFGENALLCVNIRPCGCLDSRGLLGSPWMVRR